MSVLVFPRYNWTPWRKGSVLDCFMLTWMTVGADLLSTAMSSKDRCAVRSYSFYEGTVNSPHLRKPKKAKQHAAQSRTLSYLLGQRSKVAFILTMMSIVIGMWVGRGAAFAFAFSFLIPFNTSSKRGVNCLANSSCNPDETCRLQIAERYTFIDAWESPCWSYITGISTVTM